MKWNVKLLAFNGILAAVYAVVTLLTASFAYGPVQFRIAEALCLLPMLLPQTVWGVTLGCVVANLFSPVSALDRHAARRHLDGKLRQAMACTPAAGRLQRRAGGRDAGLDLHTGQSDSRVLPDGRRSGAWRTGRGLCAGRAPDPGPETHRPAEPTDRRQNSPDGVALCWASGPGCNLDVLTILALQGPDRANKAATQIK